MEAKVSKFTSGNGQSGANGLCNRFTYLHPSTDGAI